MLHSWLVEKLEKAQLTRLVTVSELQRVEVGEELLDGNVKHVDEVEFSE